MIILIRVAQESSVILVYIIFYMKLESQVTENIIMEFLLR